jgi:hypothetical protein
MTREEQRRIYRASKDAERRYARAWGGERWGNRGMGHSDANESCPVSLEVKRSKKNMRVASEWIRQCWGHAEEEGKPPVLVITGHNDRHPIAVVDHTWLVDVCRRAGVIREAA